MNISPIRTLLATFGYVEPSISANGLKALDVWYATIPESLRLRIEWQEKPWMTRAAYRARRHAIAQAHYAAGPGLLTRYEWRQEQIRTGRHAARMRDFRAKKRAEFEAFFV